MRERMRTAILLAIVAMLAGCGSSKPATPTITAISPATVFADSGAFALTVAGTGFTNAVVTWNGQALATTVVNNGQLTAEVPADLIASPGSATIAAVNLPFAGGVTSNSMELTIGSPSSLGISKHHTGNFTQGQTGAYTLTVRNGVLAGTTSGAISVTDNLPAGLTATSISGAGWSCTLSSLTCTRSDSLNPNSSFAPITLAVNVAANAPATVTNSASVSGGGSPGTSTSDVTTVNPPAVPALSVSKTHTGNFTQGQTGATYAITVHNSGSGATAGTVTLTDTLPAGLTASGMAGTGWTCDPATLTCTRADALAPGGSYPAITLTVNVAGNAPASVINSVTLSGGGSPNSSANDPTTITVPAPPPPQPPVLGIAKAHAGNFTVGQTGATYAIAVANSGSGPTNGTVTVTDTLPAGLSATAIAGTGWNCDVTTLTCTRNDALPAGTSYPAVTLTVNVTATAPGTVTNTATVSGGGSANATATDVTNIVAGP